MGIRLDAFKLLRECKRPVPKSANGIGAWLWALQGIAITSVFTNIGTIVFTSQQVEQLLPGLSLSSKLVIFLVAEQLLLGLMWLVEVANPDIPEDVTNDIQHRAYVKEQRRIKAAAEQAKQENKKPEPAITRRRSLSSRRREHEAAPAETNQSTEAAPAESNGYRMYRIDRNSDGEATVGAPAEQSEQPEQPEENPDFCGSNVFSKNLPGVAPEGSDLTTSPATGSLPEAWRSPGLWHLRKRHGSA